MKNSWSKTNLKSRELDKLAFKTHTQVPNNHTQIDKT